MNERRVEVITGALKKAIEMKWIILNEVVRLEATAMEIESAWANLDIKEKEELEKAQLILLIDKYPYLTGELLKIKLKYKNTTNS